MLNWKCFSLSLSELMSCRVFGGLPCRPVFFPKGYCGLFSWASAAIDGEFEGDAAANGVLLLCKVDHAYDLMKDHAESFFFVFDESDDDAVPAWLLQDEFRSRAVLFKGARNYLAYVQAVCRYFADNLLWENEMDSVVYRNERLDKLVSVATTMLSCFVCITDTGFNLIHAAHREPPNSTYAHLVDNHCYGKDEIRHLNELLASRSLSSREPIVCRTPAEGDDSCISFHYPVYVDGKYVFHITAALPDDEYEDGQVHRFMKFVKRATAICTTFWRQKVEIESSCHKMLRGLIDGKKMTRDYIRTQTDFANLAEVRRFRLCVLHADNAQLLFSRVQIEQGMAAVNEGDNHAFTHENNLLMLCYSLSSDDAALSLKRTMESLEHTLSRPYGLAIGVSQAFCDLKDIRFAYLQATLALKYKWILERAYPEGYSAGCPFPAYPFEHVLPLIALLEECGEPLVLQSLETESMLQKIVREDKELGTHVAAILWSYLLNDGNASIASKSMCVHRNTVVYHIKKIESRFDMSLDLPMVKHRLIFDYFHYFRQQAYGKQ